jgi:hypothetical protein
MLHRQATSYTAILALLAVCCVTCYHKGHRNLLLLAVSITGTGTFVESIGTICKYRYKYLYVLYYVRCAVLCIRYQDGTGTGTRIFLL